MDTLADDAVPTAPRVLCFRDVPVTAWKNGAGLTRELYASGNASATAPFEWRVSIADVAADGPFSSFPGVDRTLLLLSGPAMTLTVDGVDHEVGSLVPFTFSGESTTSCRVPGGPTRDLNLMVRRGRVDASLDLHEVDGHTLVPRSGAGTMIVVVVAGRLTSRVAGAAEPLGLLDSLRLDATEPAAGAQGGDGVSLLGSGTVAVLRLSPSAPPDHPGRPA